jgi:nucleoside-diphosphate-sugar epimerase
MRSIISADKSHDTEILLLGGGGRLGRMLRQHWPGEKQPLVQSRQPGDGVLCIDPLGAPDALAAASAAAKVVICLAGVTVAHARASGDDMALNTDLALAAVRAAPKGTRIFLASSAAVYGAAEGPHLEEAAVTPVAMYGHAKRAMEVAALAQGGGRVCVLRIGNVAGADAILGGWHSAMALDQFPDGRTPRRSYIGPKTLAQVIHALCHAPTVPDILNIAAPGATQMGTLLDAAGLGWTARLPAGDVIEEVLMDTTKLAALYRFTDDECTARGMVRQWRESTMV